MYFDEKKLAELAKPRSKEAIERANERKKIRQQVR